MKKTYGNDFYKNRHNKTTYSAKTVLPMVLDVLPPVHSAIDFGCGVGTWLSALQELGIEEIQGLDGHWVDADLLEIPKQNFYEVNFENKINVEKQYDLAITLEVAEHILPQNAVGFVDSLAAASDFVLFSAAIPFQGGKGHVNEQWPDYWADIFAERGYVAIDFIRERIWNDKQIPTWYRQNILLFVKKEQLDQVKLSRLEKDKDHVPMSLVHPDKYLSMVNKMSTVKGTTGLFIKALKAYLRSERTV